MSNIKNLLEAFLRAKWPELLENDIAAEGETAYTVTPKEVGKLSFTEDDLRLAETVGYELFADEADEWGDGGNQWEVELKDGNLVIQAWFNVG